MRARYYRTERSTAMRLADDLGGAQSQARFARAWSALPIP
jgi:hypothetical protein